jgi:bacteriorhodopsin
MNLEKYESSLQFLSNKNNLLKKTFSITYTLLLTTAVITFIEAIRTPNSKIRHILNLETCISCIAGYFYTVFLEQIKDKNIIDWQSITQTRYIDWFITTPMMLLALCLVLSMNTNTIIHLKIISLIIILNYVMLLFGYLGEIKKIGQIYAMVFGFIAFLLMYLIIFINYVKPKYSKANYILFGIYFFVWSLYGVVYLFDEEYKNIITNILDLTAKCLIGLGLWVYYTNIIYW